MRRNYGLDLLRVFLCLCVIVTHCYSFFSVNNLYVSTVLMTFLAQANAMFFMLSGYFNLDKEFNDSADIKKFYKNKLINLFIPFLIFVFIWIVWDYVKTNGNFNVINILGIFYESIMNSSCDGHMWFLYSLFGFLLSTPFISKMLHHMDDKEVNIIWYICIGWNIVSIYLCNNLGIGFRYNYWFLDGWFIYYFAGYYYKRIISKQSNTKWSILGIIGFVTTIIGRIYFNDSFNGATDMQIMFILFCIGCFIFWDKTINVNNEKLNRIILFLSRNTFMIYLFNFRIIDSTQRRLVFMESGFVKGTLIVIISFVISLIAAIVFNYFLKPIQKLIDKTWKIQ